MKTYQKILLTAPLFISASFPVSVIAYMGNGSQNQYQQQLQTETQTQAQTETQTQNQEQSQNQTPTQAQVRTGFLTQFKLKLAQRIQNRIRNRLQNEYQRLEKYQQTLETKMQTKKQAGLDVSLVETELAKLSQIKADYQKYLSAYDQVVSDMNASNDPVKYRNELNNQARLANQELNKYRQTLKQAIRLMINLTKTS